MSAEATLVLDRGSKRRYVLDARSAELEALPSRFRIYEMLGKGAFKTVFRAHDLVLRREVALSFYQRVGPASLELALEEARAMSLASAHQAVVTIFDVVEGHESLCIVAEYLGGGNLRERLALAPISHALAGRTALRIAAALDFAHVRGLIHRDVKPENILFDDAAEAYLGDFGLATLSAEARPGEAPYLLGTPRYMAPEQIDGQPSAQSDLYALGCVLFEMLTRRPVFDGTPEEIIAHHRGTLPIPPRQLNPSVPPGLGHLCLQLLQKNPADRVASARQVMEAIRESSMPRVRGIKAGSGGERWIAPTASAFVGRDAELTRAEGALRSARTRIILVEGEPGVGKTALLDRLGGLASGLGYRRWTGVPLESSAVPLKAIRDWLIPQCAILAGQLPSARKVLSVASGATGGGAFESLLYELAAEVVLLAQKIPLCLLLDDLQWADSATLRWLEQVHSLLCASPESRLLLIFAFRPLPSGSELAHAVTRWWRTPGTLRFPLAPLDAEGTRALVAALTGLAPAAHLVELLATTAGGNPLFTRELLFHFDDTGRLFDRAGFLSTDVRDPDVDLPTSLRSVISLLLSGLAPDVLKTLQVAACIGTEFDRELLVSVTGLTQGILDDHLDRLVHARVIKEGGARLAFRHPLVRRGVYDAMPAAERTGLHSRVARTLLPADLERSDILIETANHAALSLNPIGAGASIETMIRASSAALEEMAWDDAIRFCEVTLECTSADVGCERNRMQLHYLAGAAYHQTGETGRGLRHLAAAAGLARTLGDLPRLAWSLWQSIRMEALSGHVRMGAPVSAREVEALIDALEPNDPSLAGRLLVALSNRFNVAGKSGNALRCVLRAQDLALRSGDDVLLGQATGSLGHVYWESLEPRSALDAWSSCEALAQRIHSHPLQARSLQRIPLALLALGQADEVPSAAAAGRAAGVHIFRTGESTYAIAAELGHALARGQLDDACRLGREGMDVIRNCGGYIGAAEWILAGYAHAAALMTDWILAGEVLEQLAKPGVVFQDPTPMEPVVRQYWQLVRVLRGEGTTVRNELLAGPPPAHVSLRLRRVAFHCLLVEAAWEASAWSLGRQYLATMRRAARSGLVLTPGWPSLLPRLCGCAAVMANEFSLARRYFDEAKGLCERHGLVAELAKTYLSLARLDALSGTQLQLEASRDKARRLLERCGMMPYLSVLHEASKWQLSVQADSGFFESAK